MPLKTAINSVSLAMPEKGRTQSAVYYPSKTDSLKIHFYRLGQWRSYQQSDIKILKAEFTHTRHILVTPAGSIIIFYFVKKLSHKFILMKSA